MGKESKVLKDSVSKISTGSHPSLVLPDSNGNYHQIDFKEGQTLSEATKDFHEWDKSLHPKKFMD